MASRTALVLLLNVLFFTMISSSYATTCSLENPLELGVCANLLGLVNVQFGSASSTYCCSLINGLVDLDATVCLCTVIKANVLGINLNLPIALDVILNACGKTAPTTCPLL